MESKFHIALISIHGLIRGENLELGRDADTGGQTLYVVELAHALARQPEVRRVDLFTRLVVDDQVDDDYSRPSEPLGENAWITRLPAGPDGYIGKEALWEHLETFADSLGDHFSQHGYPDLLHSHYADAGYVGAQVANRFGLPLIHTGHSLGRVKRRRLLASGLVGEEIERRYNISRRIDAEEQTLATAERVITSTHQEIEEQYELYDLYQPEQMRVIPPGTDILKFTPPLGNRDDFALLGLVEHFLKAPEKPMILALSRPDRRKNIVALVEAYGASPWLREHANLVVIAGNRDDIEELEEGAREVFYELLAALDRLNLYGKMALPHHHQREQVAGIYRMAAASGGVFVNPALTEPFGLTLIEASASGLPLVATEDGGPNDIIANCQNGILINPLEPETITHALEKMLKDSAYRQQCVEKGLSGVRTHYSWDAHAQKYLKMIKPLMERTELLERRPLSRRTHLFQDRAIFSDLDQNLLGDPASLKELLELVRANRKQAKFGIATGRRLDEALRVMRKYQIPVPDLLITSAGTEIYHAPKLQADDHWARHIDYHWTPHSVRRLLAEQPGLKLQPRREQSHFKISYYIDTAKAPSIDAINSLLYQEELTVNVTLAFGQFLDITPIRASKGLALRYVADRWQIPLEHIFAAGGSGADEDMMRGNTLAAVVANRHHEELSQLLDWDRIYFAKQSFAAGILESLEYYDFFGSCRTPGETTP